MGVVALLVFVLVFAIISSILLLGANKGGASKKQTAAALDAALGIVPVRKNKTKKPEPALDFRRSEVGSAIPLFNGALEKLDLGPGLRRFLSQADVAWTPGKLILLTLACFAGPAYLLNLRTHSLLVAWIVGAAASLSPTAYVKFKRAQRFDKFEKELPDALQLMVSALRVGHSFSSVMGLVTRESQEPLRGEFRIVFDEQNFGLDLRTALNNICTRVPLQDLKIAVTAILIQRESGGNLAEVLEKTAHVIRERFRLKKQVRVHTAQGRMTGLILALLPVGLGFGLYLINPENMSVLWKSDIGIKLLCGAVVMLTIGTVLIQKIVRMEV